MLLFDIGANIGKWTVANVNIYDRVIAIEPSPSAFNKLTENIEALPKCLSQNVICLNYVIYQSDKTFVNFYECKKHRYSTTNSLWLLDKRSRYYGKEHIVIPCRAMKLDQLIDVYGYPDLIKIDVEGGEYECLQTLTRKVSCICFEWAREFLDVATKCLQYLYNLGFKNLYVQFEDIYNFCPVDTEYIKIKGTHHEDITGMIEHFAKYEGKRRLDWGMIWCK